MRLELEKKWLEITHSGDSKERDRLKIQLLHMCKNAHDVLSLPAEMKEFAALLYWANNRRQGERTRDVQQCIDVAVEYILSARHRIVQDDNEIKTVELAYRELPATIRQWISRRKDFISLKYPILDEAPEDEKESVRKMLENTQRTSLERFGEIWREKKKT